MADKSEWHINFDKGAPRMARCIDGKWEYRPMTPEEEAAYVSEEAW